MSAPEAIPHLHTCGARVIPHRIATKSFSFLLARRYLNPRRAMISWFSMISLVGVMLGVLVLVVVMAVYAGLEREVKGRLLGFTPHILLKSDVGPPAPRDWRADAEFARSLPHVEGATPYIDDNVIIDFQAWQRPVLFRAIDGEDPGQVAAITEMLDREGHPESRADLGLEDAIVISSQIANQFHLGVGDTVRLYSTRNFEEVMAAYRATENPPIREAFAEDWQAAQDALRTSWKEEEAGTFTIPTEEGYNVIIDHINTIRDATIRQPERALLDEFIQKISVSENDKENGVSRFTREQRTAIEETITTLNNTDQDQMDGEVLRGLRQLVLPREVKVAGVYLSSQMAITPDLFVPIPLAQALAGLDDDVQGIALRLDDPYAAEIIREVIERKLDPEVWRTITWGEQYQAFFVLINQQRVMMYFALSFIVIVSAFSMMAVMFTVTIQKRREIGVMKALGAAPGQIVRVFLYQGMLLGLLGGGLGVGIGRLVIHFRGQVQAVMRGLGFDPFSSQFIGFDTLPAYNNPVEQIGIAIMAFVLCSLAALVPAFFASQADAAKSLRNL
jgi:lipoprotein-releasing system permease protein